MTIETIKAYLRMIDEVWEHNSTIPGVGRYAKRSTGRFVLDSVSGRCGPREALPPS
jgi:hypothetical protein